MEDLTISAADRPLSLASLSAGKPSLKIEFAGQSLMLDHSGAAYMDAYRTLIVSDLHLEKGSGAAARGRLLPRLDSRDTLQRLRQTIDNYAPARAICLGDSFHDRGAGERMAPGDRDELVSLCASVREWVWVSGNHDPELPEFCSGKICNEIDIGGVILSHEPQANRTIPQIAGHFHPKVRVSAGGGRFSGRCFCVSAALMVMPAFGAFTGGLSCADPAIRQLHKAEPRLFLLHARKLWRVR
jgi:uncharacterized protein